MEYQDSYQRWTNVEINQDEDPLGTFEYVSSEAEAFRMAMEKEADAFVWIPSTSTLHLKSAPLVLVAFPAHNIPTVAGIISSKLHVHARSPHLKKSARVGRTHGDTRSFDSCATWCGGKNIALRAITVYSSSFVNGFKCVHSVDEQTVESPAEMGRHHNPTPTEITFEDDEYITRVSGRSGDIIDHLELQTNKGRSFSFGESRGGGPFSLDIPAGNRVVGLFGGVGGHLHNLGVYYVPVEADSVEPSEEERDAPIVMPQIDFNYGTDPFGTITARSEEDALRLAVDRSADAYVYCPRRGVVFLKKAPLKLEGPYPLTRDVLFGAIVKKGISVEIAKEPERCEAGPSMREAIGMWGEVLSEDSPSLDFTFEFPNGNVIKAHKSILTSRCDFFKGLLEHAWADSTTSRFRVENGSSADFLLFLRLVYLRQVESSDMIRLHQLFSLAKFYSVPALCSAFLNNVRTLPHLLSAANAVAAHGGDEKIPDSLQKFAVKAAQTLKPDHLAGLPSQAVPMLMQWAQLEPTKALELIGKWAKANAGQSAEELMCHVDLEKVSTSQFQKLVEQPALVQEPLLSQLRAKVLKGRDFTQLPSRPTHALEGPFTDPFYLTYDPKTKWVWVADSLGNRVCAHDTTGRRLLTIKTRGRGVAVSQEGLLYVSDTSNRCINIFTQEGTLLRTFGLQRGGESMSPECLAINTANNDVHVCSCTGHAHEVSVFSADGSFKFSYGQESGLYQVSSVALDCKRGLSYVTDVYTNKVHVFSATDGKKIKTIGGDREPTEKGCFSSHSHPKRVAVHAPTGNIIVSDQGTGRVQVLTLQGEWVSEFACEEPEPLGVAVSEDGHIFVVRTMKGVEVY